MAALSVGSGLPSWAEATPPAPPAVFLTRWRTSRPPHGLSRLHAAGKVPGPGECYRRRAVAGAFSFVGLLLFSERSQERKFGMPSQIAVALTARR